MRTSPCGWPAGPASGLSITPPYFWLQRGEPFDIAPMVEALLELFVSGLRAAAILDPTLDVSAAIDVLRGDDVVDAG